MTCWIEWDNGNEWLSSVEYGIIEGSQGESIIRIIYVYIENNKI